MTTAAAPAPAPAAIPDGRALNMTVNKEARMAERLATAAPECLARVQWHKDELDNQRGRQFVNNQKAKELKEKIDNQAMLIEDAKRQERELGVYRRSIAMEEGHVRKGDIQKSENMAIGEEATGYLAALEEQQRRDRKAHKALVEAKAERVWYPKIVDLLGSAGTFTLDYDPLPDWAPQKGETPFDGATREKDFVLPQLENALEAVEDAPRPADEILAMIRKSIDANAVPFDFTGFKKHPHPLVGVPTKWIDTYKNDRVEVFDGNALLWLLGDVIKAKAAEVAAGFDDTGAIATADKPRRIKEAERAIYEQHRVIESAIQACERAGMKAPPRPQTMPLNVILVAKPFGKNSFDFG